MRARKVILWSALVLLVTLLAAGAWSYWAFRGTPDFYRPPQLTATERADAADRALDKFVQAKEWANDLWVGEQRAILANPAASRPTTSAATEAAKPLTITLTQDELNSFFEGWSRAKGWDAHYAPYVKEPLLVLRDDRLILAGTAVELNAVASVHFFPRIDEQGRFVLTLESVQAGRLPMPQVLWAGQRDRIVAAVTQRLPALQEDADIAPNGIANEAAIAADLSKLLLDVLDRRPRHPVLFLPYKESTQAAVPVRLTSVRVTDGELSLTVEPMTPADRAAVLDRIREPHPTATASAQ